MISSSELEKVEEVFIVVFKQPKYEKELLSMEKENKRSIVFDLNDIKFMYPDVYLLVINNPNQTLKIISEVAYEIVCKISRIYVSTVLHNEIKIRFTGLDELTSIRKLNSDSVGKLVKIKGMVNKTSILKPMHVLVYYKCVEADHLSAPYPQYHPFNLLAPSKCGKDGCKCDKFIIDQERSILADSQEIRIQELPEDCGQTPRDISMYIFTHELIEQAKCGDIVEVIGIMKIVEDYHRMSKSKFSKPYIVVNNLTINNKEIDFSKITEEEQKSIDDLSKNPNIEDLLIESLAPSIYGHREVKQAIIYQLLGGVSKVYENSTVRGELNILLVGDPSVAKTKILELTSRIAPRGIYASGRGVSAAGLTAACIQDKDTHDWSVQAGAMVLADKGLACLDELDKMKAEDRAALHEAMEKQTVSINKAGINTSLKTRTSVLAGANPTSGRYDTSKSVNDNVAVFSSALLSRFDLIFIMLDTPNADIDDKMAEHILSAHDSKLQPINTELMKKYIAYAHTIMPRLSKEAIHTLKSYFVKLRSESATRDSITVTARQLEGIRRLTESHARLSLKTEATIEDANAAISIMERSLVQVTTDPATGSRNIDRIDAKAKSETILDYIYSLLPDEEPNIISKLMDKGIDGERAYKLLKQLVDSNKVYNPQGKTIAKLNQSIL